jgi:hypothetical protein
LVGSSILSPGTRKIKGLRHIPAPNLPKKPTWEAYGKKIAADRPRRLIEPARRRTCQSCASSDGAELDRTRHGRPDPTAFQLGQRHGPGQRHFRIHTLRRHSGRRPFRRQWRDAGGKSDLRCHGGAAGANDVRTRPGAIRRPPGWCNQMDLRSAGGRAYTSCEPRRVQAQARIEQRARRQAR